MSTTDAVLLVGWLTFFVVGILLAAALLHAAWRFLTDAGPPPTGGPDRPEGRRSRPWPPDEDAELEPIDIADLQEIEQHLTVSDPHLARKLKKWQPK